MGSPRERGAQAAPVRPPLARGGAHVARVATPGVAAAVSSETAHTGRLVRHRGGRGYLASAIRSARGRSAIHHHGPCDRRRSGSTSEGNSSSGVNSTCPRACRPSTLAGSVAPTPGRSGARRRPRRAAWPGSGRTATAAPPCWTWPRIALRTSNRPPLSWSNSDLDEARSCTAGRRPRRGSRGRRRLPWAKPVRSAVEVVAGAARSDDRPPRAGSTRSAPVASPAISARKPQSLAHHLDDEAAVRRHRRLLDLVDVGHDAVERGVGADAQVRRRQVVVDRRRHAHDRDRQRRCRRRRVRRGRRGSRPSRRSSGARRRGGRRAGRRCGQAVAAVGHEVGWSRARRRVATPSR